MSLTTRLWHEEDAVHIWDMVNDLDAATSLDALFSAMMAAPRNSPR
jgi:hypothetical protein